MQTSGNKKRLGGGYYLKARCIQESEIAHASPCIREIWDWFLMRANYKTIKRNGQLFNRGQLICTYEDIQEALHWFVGWRKKKYSKDQIASTMKWLKKRDMVTTKKTTRGVIVTICNYHYFQTSSNYEDHKDDYIKTTEGRETSDTINKKEKNSKRRNKEVYAVFFFWNKQKIITHKSLEKFSPHINARMAEGYGLREIIDAIKNYETILIGDEYYWSHKWSLDEFLSRKGGLDKFITINKPFENFRSNEKTNNKSWEDF